MLAGRLTGDTSALAARRRGISDKIHKRRHVGAHCEVWTGGGDAKDPEDPRHVHAHHSNLIETKTFTRCTQIESVLIQDYQDMYRTRKPPIEGAGDLALQLWSYKMIATQI
jgi:hypothetical protein